MSKGSLENQSNICESHLFGVPDFHSVAKKNEKFHVASSWGEFQFPYPSAMRRHRSRNTTWQFVSMHRSLTYYYGGEWRIKCYKGSTSEAGTNFRIHTFQIPDIQIAIHIPKNLQKKKISLLIFKKFCYKKKPS